jgi:hypothetical protein
MLHLNSKGFTFDEHNGGKNPLGDLSSLLSGAYSSFNGFDNCIQNTAASSLHEVSALCRDLQSVNISLLQQALVDEGVQPDDSPDFWHSLTGLIRTTAAFISDEVLLAAFRKSELDLFSEYESKIASFDGDHLLLVQGKLIPNQMRICELLGAIRGGAGEIISEPDIPLNLDLA